MKNDVLGVALLSSVAIHICVILIASMSFHNSHLHRQDFLPISLVDLPRPETPSAKKIETVPELRKSPPPSPKVGKSKQTRSMVKAEVVEPRIAAPLPAPPQKESAKLTERQTPVPEITENVPRFAPEARIEGGGSEAGAGNLFSKGDVGVVPGPGTAGGGGGTAASGLGSGSGAPSLPAQTAPLKTNREAKPIKTARAAYPPMALRAGRESDVTLRIEVDAEGKVTKAEITKSGGAGFDEEALKAVKQTRFESAQRDGQYVAAEFTYIYRFRLQR